MDEKLIDKVAFAITQGRGSNAPTEHEKDLAKAAIQATGVMEMRKALAELDRENKEMKAHLIEIDQWVENW